MEPGNPLEFPRSIIWRSGAPPKVAFFALEDTWGENPSFGSGPKEGVFYWRIDVFFATEGETVDHILLHCAKCWILWQLLFSLFGLAWVISSSVKETLLGWHGSLWVKPARRHGRWLPYVFLDSVERKELASI